ncbi:hypothetical protein EES39_08235 [Streptomyces sp. ADI92-24]|nr:hypothetical protein EES39_08235 [Streptomyces sp. ADI92-24]
MPGASGARPSLSVSTSAPASPKASSIARRVRVRESARSDADQLYVKYGSREQVVEAATRSSAAVDHELGLEFRHCSCEVLLAA